MVVYLFRQMQTDDTVIYASSATEVTGLFNDY